VLDHHRQAVDRLTAELSSNLHFVAVLLAGSIARGTERPDSDVDLILLATDEEYARERFYAENFTEMMRL
jgi:predicted nucleotidyltransferase